MTKKITKRIISFMVTLTMAAALVPNTAFAETSGVPEPWADENIFVGSLSSDDAQSPEDAITDEDLADTDGEEIPEAKTNAEASPSPTAGADADASDNGIALMALDDANKTVMKEYFKQFPGEYTLPDGSGWKVIVSTEGEVTISSGDDKTDNAYIDSITTSGTSVKTVVFASPDWYNSKGSSAPQKLTLTWTTTVNSSDHRAFKCSTATFYDADKNLIKGFTTNSYFIANDGIFSYEYFKDYAGTYSLSDAYGTVYNNDIEGIGAWKIEVANDGHVYLHEGDKEYEAVMTACTKTNNQGRVSKMVAAVPGWYTNDACTAPAYVTLTWDADSDNKSANYGEGALYFDISGSSAGKGLAVYKPGENGDTGKKAISACIPAMRFERSEITEFAKSYLKNYQNTYYVNDDSGETIEIGADGVPVLHAQDGKDLTPLYYTVNNTDWLADDPENSKAPSKVTSVAYSAEDWYAQNAKPKTVDRTRLTLNWDEVNKQFAVSANATCCKDDGETVSHTYTTDMRYSTKESIEEVEAYFSQFVKGTYTLNDGSGWKIKAALDESDKTWKIYTDFDDDEEENYTKVMNPAPVFVQDTTYTGENGKGEYGNKGKYLTTVSVPVKGWYIDEECKQEAVVTLNWKGNVVNPIDDHQFTVTAIPIYRHNPETDELECKYMAGTFYSDEDREKGKAFLKSIGVAGTYQPTEAKGKWHIEIDDNGKVTIYAYDSQNEEHVYEDVAMDLTMDKKATNHNNPNFGQIKGVTDIKVVIPEWRTEVKNDTLANIMQCEETTFTFTAADNGSSYFVPSVDAIKYANADKDGNPWEVKTKTSQPGYNKDLFTKIYKNDRAYSDASKEEAKKYFKDYPGTYCIEDPDLDYKLTVTEEGEIYWGDYASGKAPLPADVQFDAIRDENHDGKVNEGENTVVPGTISVWLNGYSTGKYTEKNKDTQTTDGTQRADLTWNDTYVDDQPNTEHKFKTSGKSTVKGYEAGTTQITFALDKYYVPRGDDVAEEDFVQPGTYETTDAKYKIVIEKDDETGKFTYTFYRPDTPDTEYPLKLFGSGDAAYLRGKIGTMKSKDVYIVVTKGPYDGFLLTGYEVTYNDLNGKSTNSSSADTFTLPARTRFTDYSMHDTPGNIHVVNSDTGKDEKYTRLSLALHELEDGDTIYLDDDITVGFEAKLPDNVGNVTIDGQGHKITRDTFVNPNTIIMDPEISLTELEEEGAELPEEHYDGGILHVGAGDTVTLKNVTIDGEGKWEIDQDKLKIDKELNEDYDVNVLDAPGGGHPIKELPGNLVSTDSLIKVVGGTLILDKVTMENFFAGDGYDDDRHFIDFTSTEDGKLEIKSETVFKHNASRSGVCIGNTDKDEILLSDCTTMEDNYCYGGNGGLVVAMEGTQVYMDDGTKIINNVAADTNGTFVQLHKKTDGVKDGDNKGEIYAKLHMNGGEIGNNVGLRGGSYGWGNTVYLYNGGAFEMNGGEIHDNMGAGISSIYQQPSADALMLNGGKIYGNTCSLKDEGTDWALDIALMNIGTIGEDMFVGQNFVVGAAAILGGYASGDEYLTNNGTIEGNISVYSYFNNEGNVSTVVNNHIIDGDIRLENGSMVKNSEEGLITGNVTIRGALTESAGESSFHNEGDIKGNIELAEGAHLYNSGEVYGDVTVKSGGTLELNCNEEGHSHGGVIHGDVYLYPDGLIYADVKPTQIDGTIYLEYETEEDRDRMLDVLKTCGIEYADVVATPHVHAEYEETVEEPDSDYKCTDPWVTLKTCKACGKVVERVESEPTGHDYYVASVTDETCTTGKIEHIRCENCSAYNSTTKELKHYVSEPLGHNYVENEDLHIPATEYASGHEYYICTVCGDLLEIEIPELAHGADKHSFQTDDGELNEDAGVETKSATCTEAGEMTFTCTGCDAEITIAIPAKGHRYPEPEDYEEIGRTASTCTTAGQITYAPRCIVCDKIDESNKITVFLPRLQHEWSAWADVEEGNYLCTAERKQTRECELCGTTEERMGGETGHTWEYNEAGEPVTCTVCGYTTIGHNIDYRLNGGVAPASLANITDRVYTPGKPATLWAPADGESWTKNTATGQAVFIGWCSTDLGAAPLTAEPEDELISEVAIPEDADAIVFAVWASDKNRNAKPDYSEGTISIKYDKNGGDGVEPEHLTGILPGAAYPLETSPELTKGDAIFAGWSLEPANKVITTAEDEESLEIIKSLLISPYTVPENADEDITLYAAYAQDSDNNGRPDYSGRALHVEYYINGGTVHEGYAVNDNDMFYVCNDYHLPGTNAALLAVEYGRTMIYRDKAVLIGWSAAPHADLITSEEEIGDLPITEVSLTGAESNAKVYALWAADENDNHIADYMESMLMHTYHRNQFLAENGGRTIEAGWKLDIQLEEPERQNSVLLGMSVELAPNDYFGSADLLDDENNKQGHYVQVGWSGYSHGACGSKTDYNNWVIAGDANGYTGTDGKYYRTIYDTRFQNAYAVWAIDSDENDVADYLETHYTVTLDLNGGSPTEEGFPHTTVVDAGDTFTFPADPIKAGYTFKGWKTKDDERLYKAGETVTVNADVTYTAQYEAVTYTVTLDINGGTGGDDFTEENPVNEGESFTFPADPTKEGYTFLCWSAEGDENLYKAGDTVTVNADVTYTAQYEPITAPNTFKVTLDLNGGTGGEGFTAENSVNEGESFTFPADPTKTGYTFLGWSVEGDENLYKAGDTVTVNADITFTAQWNTAGSTSRSGGGSSSYTVQFETNGGSKVASQRVSRNGVVKEPTAPTKDGYTFAGWYTDKALTTEYDFTSKVTRSFTLYAKWNDEKSDDGTEATPAPTKTPVSTPNPGTDGATLNFEDHYAYIIGYPDGNVHPDDTITRAEVATIFYRLMSDESRDMFMTKVNSYSDIAPEDWYNTAVSTMSAALVIKGCDDGAFAPSKPITRAEFAAMAARFDSDEYSGEDRFPDISEHWAREEINRAAQKGWVSGYQNGTFEPERYITRAEAMRLVNRVLGRIPSAEHLHDDMTVWSDNSDKSAWYYADVQEATNSHYYEKNGEDEIWTAIRETRNWAELER